MLIAIVFLLTKISFLSGAVFTLKFSTSLVKKKLKSTPADQKILQNGNLKRV